MGKRIRPREARRRQHDKVVCAVLKSHSQEKARARVRRLLRRLQPEYRRKVEG